MSETNVKLREKVEQLLDEGCLTKFEDSFCVSLIDQMDRGRVLSERQIEILEKIYEEKTK